MTSDAPTRVLLADPLHLVRETLAGALRDDGAIEIVGEVSAGREAVRTTVRLRPDVAVLRAALPGLSGPDACRAIGQAGVGTQVIIVDDAATIEGALAAVEAGATGYVALDGDLDGFVEDLHRAAGGETILPPRMLGRLLRRLIIVRRQRSRMLERYLRLTPREREVLTLLVSGCDQDTVATRLVISPETARSHIQSVLTKLEVGSRHEAVALAVHQGWVDPAPAMPDAEEVGR